MSDVLTQEEIDHLLRAIGTGYTTAPDDDIERILVEAMSLLPQRVAIGLRSVIAKWDRELADMLQPIKLPFEIVLHLSDSATQYMLRGHDQRTLAIALGGSSAELKNKILSNLSKRNRDLISEEIDIVSSPDKDEIEMARSKILAPIERCLREEIYYTIKMKRSGSK